MDDISQYIGMCNLQHLKRKNNEAWNFRCQVCGDSKKNSKKTRGWITWNKKNGNWHYYCYNCNISMGFTTFLKTYYSDIFKDYIKENYKNKYQNYRKPVKSTKDVFEKNPKPKFKDDFFRLDKLEKDHPAIQYVESRMIPPKFYSYLGYTDNYQKWINKKIPDKFENPAKEDNRLIIPFYNKDGDLFGAAGRSLDPNNDLRYITIKFDDDTPKIFGMDRVNVKKTVYVLEGQIDSLFVDNGVAISGADINSDALTKLIPKENIVFIFDNEVNESIFSRIDKLIMAKFKVCLLPVDMRSQGKDINDYIKNGFTKIAIHNIIKQNTYSGLTAKTKFMTWKRRK